MAQNSCQIRLILSVFLKRVPLPCRSRFLAIEQLVLTDVFFDAIPAEP